VSTFTMSGVFIVANGTPTNLDKSVWRPVVAGQPRCMAGWISLHQLSPLTRASPPRVDARQPRLGLNCLKPWPGGRPLGSLGLGSGSLGPHVKYTPVVMMILTFGQLYFVIP
jgi:hypothetical protein